MAEAASIVYVVDDDESMREALASLLRSVGLHMEGFALPKAFLAFDRPQIPSCLVLDIRLPGTSGLEFQRDMKRRAIDIPVIFITGHGDIPMSVRAMKAGALEFLTKPFRDQELLDAIQIAIDRDAAQRMERQALAELRSRFGTLTLREQEVMAILVRGQLNKQIGAAIGTTESTVKAHRTQIMRKMRAGSIAELVGMSDKLDLEQIAS